MSDDTVALLREQNRLIRAQIALTSELVIRLAELGSSRFGNVESILDSAGLKKVEIAALLGKTPQSVGQAIAKKRLAQAD